MQPTPRSSTGRQRLIVQPHARERRRIFSVTTHHCLHPAIPSDAQITANINHNLKDSGFGGQNMGTHTIHYLALGNGVQSKTSLGEPCVGPVALFSPERSQALCDTRVKRPPGLTHPALRRRQKFTKLGRECLRALPAAQLTARIKAAENFLKPRNLRKCSLLGSLCHRLRRGAKTEGQRCP